MSVVSLMCLAALPLVVQMRNVLFVTVFDRYLTVLRLCIGHIFFQIAGHTNGFRLCIGQFDMIDAIQTRKPSCICKIWKKPKTHRYVAVFQTYVCQT